MGDDEEAEDALAPDEARPGGEFFATNVAYYWAHLLMLLGIVCIAAGARAGDRPRLRRAQLRPGAGARRRDGPIPDRTCALPARARPAVQALARGRRWCWRSRRSRSGPRPPRWFSSRCLSPARRLLRGRGAGPFRREPFVARRLRPEYGQAARCGRTRGPRASPWRRPASRPPRAARRRLDHLAQHSAPISPLPRFAWRSAPVPGRVARVVGVQQVDPPDDREHPLDRVARAPRRRRGRGRCRSRSRARRPSSAVDDRLPEPGERVEAPRDRVLAAGGVLDQDRDLGLEHLERPQPAARRPRRCRPRRARRGRSPRPRRSPPRRRRSAGGSCASRSGRCCFGEQTLIR